MVADNRIRVRVKRKMMPERRGNHNKMPSLKALFGLGRVLLLGCSVVSPALQAQNAWAFETVSPPIYRLDQPIQQPFITAELANPPADGARIKAINVQISPSASAWVESRLCTADLLNCLPVYGGRLYTKAFNQFAATTPLVMVHQVQAWNGAYPPIYIKVQLNIWW